MGFSKQEYWSGLPFPLPWDLPKPGIEPGSPALQADSLLSEPPEKLIVSTGLPFQNVCIVGTIQYVTFSYCLFSLDNMHLSFLHGLIVSHQTFFLVMNNILLSGCTTFYLFIHLLKDILVDTEFW